MISTVHAAHLGTHTHYSGGNINILFDAFDQLILGIFPELRGAILASN